jgi:hypothetical protein
MNDIRLIITETKIEKRLFTPDEVLAYSMSETNNPLGSMARKYLESRGFVDVCYGEDEIVDGVCVNMAVFYTSSEPRPATKREYMAWLYLQMADNLTCIDAWKCDSNCLINRDESECMYSSVIDVRAKEELNDKTVTIELVNCAESDYEN